MGHDGLALHRCREQDGRAGTYLLLTTALLLHLLTAYLLAYVTCAHSMPHPDGLERSGSASGAGQDREGEEAGEERWWLRSWTPLSLLRKVTEPQEMANALGSGDWRVGETWR